MSRTLFFYVARLYVLLALSSLMALTVVFLVIDFGDRLRSFIDSPVVEVLRLYGFKALVALHQLAPAALLLAGGATVSIFRKRAEWLAMQAAGASRWVMVLPIAVPAMVFAGGLVVFDEYVVTHAGTRSDEISANVFNRWGDYRFFYFPKQWFRVGPNVFQIRGATDADGTLRDVSIFAMGPAFHLEERIDAATMKHLEGQSWELGNAVVRRFDASDGSSSRQESVRLTRALEGSTSDVFRVRAGRPELMRSRDILEQQEIRAKVGLPTQRFWLALHNRFAYPMTGVAAAMLAVALALRPARHGHLTLALVEGLVVAVALVAFMLVGKSLVLGDHIPAVAAAWAPVAGLLIASATLWFAAERRS